MTWLDDRRDDDEYAICPHCEAQHGDCWEWVTGDEVEHECESCGGKYIAYAEYEVTYHTRKAPPEVGR